MALSQKKSYTIVDYYNLPENVRAEIIDGQIYYQAVRCTYTASIREFIWITNNADIWLNNC